ncbi:MAG: alpha/beta hydrolase [Gammaproteobacteria bacterium]
MFSSYLSWIQKVQPISYTGAFAHSLLWLSGGARDVVLKNPNFKAPSKDSGLEKGIAIYCVHGTADRVSAFTLIANRLLDKLPSAISAIHLIAFDRRGEGVGIENFAEQLKQKIIANKDTHVILMGHSRGGLVNAKFAVDLAADAGINVYAIHSVCTPYQGSFLALPPLTSISRSINQMKINSDFLADLAVKIAQHKSCQYHYYAAENDSIVSTDAACIKAEGHASLLFDRHGHLSLMSSHRLVEHIRKTLVSLVKNLLKEQDEVKEETETAAFDDDFVIVLNSSSALANICYDIDLQIEKIKSQNAPSELAFLIKLQKHFVDMLDEVKVEKYSEAYTIDKFIRLSLADNPLESSGAQTNYVSFLFKDTKSNSLVFIEKLLEKYKDISLLRKPEGPSLESDDSKSVTLGRR